MELLNIENTDIPIKFKEFWLFLKGSRLMRIAAWFNVFFLFGTSVFYLLSLFQVIKPGIFATDFRVFYSSVHLLQSDPLELYYNPSNQLPFRYLPFFAYLNWYLAFLPFEFAYLMNNFMMFFVNWINFFLIYYISLKFYKIDPSKRSFEYAMFILILNPLQVPNYILGQINLLFITFLLLSLLFLEYDQNFLHKKILGNGILSGFSLGFAITFKPLALLLIPFLLDISIEYKEKFHFHLHFNLRKTLNRLSGILIIIGINLLIFLKYPTLFIDFIRVNFMEILAYHQSTSLTRLIIQIAALNGVALTSFSLMLVISGLLFIVPYCIFLFRPKSLSQFSYFFTYAMLVVLIAYPDSWFLYILFFFVFFLPSILQMEQFYGEQQRKGIIIVKYLTKILQLYFAVGVVLHYIILGYDPLTPSILLLIYGLFLYLHITYLKNQSGRIKDST
jgi:hypothetical protein